MLVNSNLSGTPQGKYFAWLGRVKAGCKISPEANTPGSAFNSFTISNIHSWRWNDSKCCWWEMLPMNQCRDIYENSLKHNSLWLFVIKAHLSDAVRSTTWTALVVYQSKIYFTTLIVTFDIYCNVCSLFRSINVKGILKKRERNYLSIYHIRLNHYYLAQEGCNFIPNLDFSIRLSLIYDL